MIPFSFRQLGYFVAAGEHDSVTLAARAMNVSQPSVSTAIAHLEGVFGVQLFVRHRAQGIALTPAGRRLMAEARGLLNHAEDFRLNALGLGEALAGELEVGCFLTFAPVIMPGLLRAFEARFPDIRVRLHEEHLPAIQEGLIHSRFEIALTYDLEIGRAIEFEPLAEVPVHVILPADHRFARDDTVSLAALAGEPLVLLGLPRSREYFLAMFPSLGVEPVIAYETPSFEMVRGLVANGYGYSLMHSRPPSDRTLDDKTLVYRPLSERVRPTWLGIARLGAMRSTRMVTAFAGFCREYFAHHPVMAGEMPTR